MEANPLPREKIDPKASFPLYHVLMLVVSLLFVVFFAEKLAFPIEYAIEKMKAPKVVGGFLIALLVLLPESLTAIEAAICNGLQRSVNILLGSVCATIGLTLPLILAFSLLKSSSLILGLGQVEATLLVLTLLLCQITFSGGKTNILQGAVHLLLFFSYLIMMFD
ncbi:Ca2+/H+ antiporter (fragment) [Methylacidiphilum fumariolicum SolV]|uniref:Ca2+/H+ antiporter n=3 Tax=Candidatus Methylacidiphilum fumarolicum TaxID=591154 RepID=I0JVV6_METFB